MAIDIREIELTEEQIAVSRKSPSKPVSRGRSCLTNK